jgi:hypothetical protein
LLIRKEALSCFIKGESKEDLPELLDLLLIDDFLWKKKKNQTSNKRLKRSQSHLLKVLATFDPDPGGPIQKIKFWTFFAFFSFFLPPSPRREFWLLDAFSLA